MNQRSLDRLAELAVVKGANLQPGQIVSVTSALEKADVARAVAEAAYKHGAKFVDVWYVDYYIKRARIAHAAEDTLDFVPSWYGERMLALGQQRCARIILSGPATPGLLADLDPARVGRDQLPALKEVHAVVNERTTNWTAAPAPTRAWAELLYPGLRGDEALSRLWEEIEFVCRMDSPDPTAAWQERMDFLEAVASRLTERRFDALHFEGPGTDFTVGLLPSSTWMSAKFTTVDGIVHMPNLPTEEVFTSPDPERAEGVVRATKPLVLQDGTIITGLTLRFEEGRAVQIEADRGADTLRVRCAKDDGASRLGEVALVDGESRVGALGTIFYDTLLDENAASHLALGNGFDFVLAEPDRPTAKEPKRHPHRFHDRRERCRGHRNHRYRRTRANPAGRRLADLVRRVAWPTDHRLTQERLNRRPPFPGVGYPCVPLRWLVALRVTVVTVVRAWPNPSRALIVARARNRP